MKHTPGPWILMKTQHGIAIKEATLLQKGFADRIANPE